MNAVCYIHVLVCNDFDLFEKMENAILRHLTFSGFPFFEPFLRDLASEFPKCGNKVKKPLTKIKESIKKRSI
jgi:hypothetical protein